MVQVWCSVIHPRHWTKTEELERYRSRHITPSQLHLCNRETFLFHFDHQRYYEALFKESSQVQETISAYHTWAWASNFDIYDHWPHWSHAIHSCLWLRVHKRTSGRWRQCECSAFPFFTLRISMYWLIVIEQTAHNLGISTSVSASEISDFLPVSIPAAGANLIS